MDSMDTSSEAIKSDAIIKYDSLSTSRSQFLRLSEQTNLKTPPDNWLCGRFGDYNWSYPLENHNSSLLSSFRMANNFPECVGNVDVIADSDSIKKLLLMPFDSKNISLMVHRIGNSLLIDEFDLANHLIHNQKQWSWLKRFIDDMIVPTNYKPMKKLITRDELQSKNMFSKFLHYSITENPTEREAPSQDSPLLQLSPKSSSRTDKECHKSEDLKRSEFYFSHYNKESEMSEMAAKQLDQIEDSTTAQIPGSLRNVLWNFEDIRMLVASNMPIFGDDNHPAVSLRLHDMKRPINVLTGLDYWLDNLMSSVPEVVMCYHLEGIVQKYELIKTEDIPEMSANKGSLFSPIVIRNIAQNILSFLKSKATKSGHTYWLFKGRHDDVVKLYDLTTLCADYMEENDSNPYALPVAMLLYRVAKNMRDANLTRHSPAISSKIHKLLTNCLSLLDPIKHSQIVSSANYLLSDVYVPNDIDPTLLPVSHENIAAADDEYSQHFEDFDSSEESSDESNCPTLEVKKLGFPDYYRNNNYEKQKKQKPSNELNDENIDWNTKCERALKHIIKGLNSVTDSYAQKEEELSANTSNGDYSPKMANPSEAIPLAYSCLKQSSSDQQNKNICGKELTQKTPPVIPDWRTCLEVCLLQKGAQVFCILAELANSKSNCLNAFKYIRMGIMCYEMALIVIKRSTQNNYFNEPIACLLALCGDVHIKILSTPLATDETDNDMKAINDLYFTQLTAIFEKLSESELTEEFCWAYNSVIVGDNSVEERLKLCYRCYEEASFQLNVNQTNKVKTENTLHERLIKRLGYICNESANHYMNKSLKDFNQTLNNSSNEHHLNDKEVALMESLTNKSLFYFEKAIELFRKVDDKENTSLMMSNTGRLMRTCAHIFAPTFRYKSSSKEFSTKEKHFYVKAIDYYRKAINELGPKGQSNYPNAWSNIKWELCTTLYTIGCLLQDFAPLSTSAFEVVEEEINKYLTEALNICQNAQKWETSRQVLYQYRAAAISHRLGSLFHNSYRNMSDECERRKKVFKCADDYYERSSTLYRTLGDKEEYLSVTLERIGLHERNLSQLSGFTSKLKAIHLIITIMLAIGDIDCTDVETEEDKQKIENCLQLFEARIHFGVKGLIKCLSTKASKHKELIQKWKTIDEFIANIENSKKFTIYEKVNQICDKLLSSKLMIEIDLNRK